MIVASNHTFHSTPSRQFAGALFSLLLVVASSLIISLTGCGGGGGGGGGSSPVGPIVKPDAVTLNISSLSKNQTAQIGFANRQLALTVPSGTSARYGMVITAENANAGGYRLLGNGGGGTKFASLRAESLLEPRSAFPNQAAADAIMRHFRPQNGQAAPSIPAPAIRAADTSGENIGTEVAFQAYSGNLVGTSYSTRRAILRRQGIFCKIFVDPDAYQGLSAVDPGTYQIKESDLDTIQARFDQVIYPFITQNYGNTFDKDSDGKVTIFFSPLYTKLGFAGLFDPIHLYSKATQSNSNERDMFVIFTPDSQFNGENWLKVSLETVCHEFQHLSNYIARHQVPSMASIKPEEDSWLDEALSVGAEARYRVLISDTPGEDRFKNYLSGMRYTSLTNFALLLANYGAGGLFTTYLYDRAGAGTIKSLVQSDLAGIANINSIYSSYGGFSGVFRSWAQALFTECHRTLVDFSTLDSSLKYANNLGLSLESSTPRFTTNGAFEVSMAATSMFFAILEPSAVTSDGYLTITLDDPDNASMTCSLIRLK